MSYVLRGLGYGVPAPAAPGPGAEPAPTQPRNPYKNAPPPGGESITHSVSRGLQTLATKLFGEGDAAPGTTKTAGASGVRPIVLIGGALAAYLIYKKMKKR